MFCCEAMKETYQWGECAFSEERADDLFMYRQMGWWQSLFRDRGVSDG